ncbi:MULTISPECIES: response regulator [Halomonadaceae]|uniref:response regulator n=1 Tax=Halomonadaceae TaxID=28256 RepID=UPI001597CBF9|nr:MULTISPECIES: response regulator [Halomonas]QJQ96889.1 response regulator [Halomonas sp. PA5]
MQDSWDTLTWLLAALVLGSSLCIGTFLLLLRHRLQAWESAFGMPYERLERVIRDVHKELPPWLKIKRLLPVGRPGDGQVARLDALLDSLEVLLERLANRPQLIEMLERLPQPAFLSRHEVLVEANTAFEKIMGRSLSELRGLEVSYLIRHDDSLDDSPDTVRVHDGEGQWQSYRLIGVADENGHRLGLLDDVYDQRQRLAQVKLSRDQAREESRLKSSYLGVLHKELHTLMDDLARQEGVVLTGTGEQLSERLAGLLILVTRLVESPESPRLASQEGAASVPVPLLSRARVLIVDDGPVNSMLACQVLEAQGAQVDTAQDGPQALRLAQRNEYDLVFMDIFMPGPDGMETSRRWRQGEVERGQDRPSTLIALTANADDDDRQQYLDAGMDDFLAKPYRPQVLVDMAARWMTTRKARGGHQ